MKFLRGSNQGSPVWTASLLTDGYCAQAFEHLREAVRREDALPYCDPPPWFQPSRHALGALLLEQGHAEEAESVYREDLGFSPDTLPRRRARINNTFGLHGLYECLLKLGKDAGAKIVKVIRDIAVGSADVPIAASCFCALKAMNAVNNGTNGHEAAIDSYQTRCCNV
ncbi:hypothetical protein BDW59DRAFT_157871 [Aspergillus cavernicola]|uniref:Uncharacterized protein n=1 Tax=Aspergillus cavernicola TaxID=176166 RepID=A0ABR4IUJ9_9EURO